MSAIDRMKVILNHLSSPNSPYYLKAASSALNISDERVNFNQSIDSNLRFTQPFGKLNFEQRLFYENNGYILVKNLVCPRLLDECRQHFVDLCEGKIDSGNMLMMKDIDLKRKGATGEFLINKIQDILWDETFMRYISSPEILDIVESFCGPNIMAVHSMLINKPPDSGANTSQHPPHQDLHYFPFRPSEKIVAVWTAMERVHKLNGCLYVIPGSHKSSLLPHGYPQTEVNAMYHGILDLNGVENAVSIEMDEGDTIFFHPLLIHGSGVNVTQGFRKAISCHYAASECHYIDVSGTSQQVIADEVLRIARKKGLNVDYQRIWKLRSRLVRGSEVNL